jgi:hypothetical protein
MFGNYDFNQNSLIWNGILFEQFADGTGIVVTRNEDSFTTYVGNNGDVTRSKNNNGTGLITVTLKQLSVTNKKLYAFSQLDELQGNVYAPILLRDASQKTIFSAENAWIVKPADAEYAKESGVREWQFSCDRLIMGIQTP